jgi:hypothetical protein
MASILSAVNVGSGGLRLSEDIDPGANRPAFGPESTSHAIRGLHYCNVRYAQARLLAHLVALGMHGDGGQRGCEYRSRPAIINRFLMVVAS